MVGLKGLIKQRLARQVSLVLILILGLNKEVDQQVRLSPDQYLPAECLAIILKHLKTGKPVCRMSCSSSVVPLLCAVLLLAATSVGLVRQSNAFGFDLHKTLANQVNEGNFIASPFSVSVMLAIMASGARGSTAKELSHVMYGSNYTSGSQEDYTKMYTLLLDDNSKIMTTANMVYPAINFRLLDSYKRSVSDRFNATVEEKDFSRPAVKDEINESVERETNGRIQDLIKEPLNEDTRMALINTVLFTGGWEEPFPEDHTVEADFYAEDGTKRGKVQLMSDYHRHILCTHDQDLQAKAVQLRYNDSASSMVVILPDRGVLLQKVVSRLTSDKFTDLIDLMRSQPVDIWLPKFKIESSHNLIDSLRRLGVKDLFDPRGRANLSGMTPEAGLYVSDALQRATIEVNERGTEAAAATFTRIEPASALDYEPFTFRADRPFMFIVLSEVMDVSNNGPAYVPLFTGTFAEPH